MLFIAHSAVTAINAGKVYFTSIQAEGVFGVLKQDHVFRRFLCMGKNNIRTEFLLLGLAYNIKKLFAKISENRIGISLFELKTA